MGAQAATLRHFLKHLALLTTMWKILPEIARVVGADVFEPCLGQFVEPLSYSVSCEDNLTVATAKTCVSELDRFLGRDMFSKRVRLQNADAWDILLPACLAS